MLSDKVGNWNFVNFPQWDGWDNSVSINFFVGCIASIVVFFEDASLEDLTVMNNLFDWGPTSCSGAVNGNNCWVFPLRWRNVSKISNGITEEAENSAEWFEWFILIWGGSDSIETKSVHHRQNWPPVFGGFLHHAIWWISQVDDWSAGNEDLEFVTEVTKVQSQGSKHLGGSLRMSNIGDLRVSSFFENIVNLSWSIVLTQLKEGVVIENFWGLRWRRMISCETVLVSSVVTKPDIIACLSNSEGKRFVFMEAPGISITKETVLDEDWLLRKKYWIRC